MNITRHECSELGLLILDFACARQSPLLDVAKQLDISPAVLRIVCDKNGTPGTRLISKLSGLLSKTELEIEQMIFRNKIKQIDEQS